MNMLDLVIDMADLPNKDELVERIRKINGQRDPDAEQTPEEQQAEQAQQQQQAEEGALNKRTAEANLKILEAKVANLEKQTEKIDAERLTKIVEAMFTALQAGGIVASMPGVAPVADEILLGAGYQDQAGGQDPNIPDVSMQQDVVEQTPSIDYNHGLVGHKQGMNTPENDTEAMQ